MRSSGMLLIFFLSLSFLGTAQTNTPWSTSTNIGIGTGSTPPANHRLELTAANSSSNGSTLSSMRVTSTAATSYQQGAPTPPKTFEIRHQAGSSTQYIDVFNVHNSGSVSIGSGNERSKLDINGDLGLYKSDNHFTQFRNATDYAELKWSNNIGSSKRFRFYYHDPVVSANSKEVLSIMPSGNVGIGTTTPYTGLHVKTAATWGTAVWLDGTAGSGGKIWAIQSTSNGSSQGGGRFVIRDESTSNSIVAITSGATADDNKVAVNGRLTAREVQVSVNQFPDYVFKAGYRLMPLSDVKAYIDSEGHLPNVPSESEVVSNGLDVGEMTTIMMEKIEELTLYIIEQEARIEELESQEK